MEDLTSGMKNFYASLDISGWQRPDDSGDNIVFTFPTGKKFVPIVEHSTWNSVKNYPVLTDRLWAYSLKYAWWLFRNGYRQVAINTITSYYHSTSQNGSSFEKNLPGSWDHATSIRLTLLSCMLPELHENERKQFEKYIQIELNWACVDANIKNNNHGFMLVVSILIADVSLRKFIEGSGNDNKLFAIVKFRQILQIVFGEDKFCNENSPFYAHFYVHTLKSIRKQFFGIENLTDFHSLINEYISSGQETLEKIIHPNAEIPPMGDSSVMATRYTSIPGTHHSARTGFWVHKSQDRYLSFKCGFDTLVHKHADDTSITLRIRDKDFLIDSGFCSYNYADSRVASLRTQKSHSGVYFKELDNEYPAKLYKSPHFSTAGLVVGTTNQVKGWSVVGGENFVSRTIDLVDDQTFVVSDSFYTKQFQPPVRRFIVPSEVSIDVLPTSMRLVNEGEWVEIKFDSEVKMSVASGVIGADTRGWMSQKANSIVPSKCIDIISTDESKFPSFIIKTS